MKKLVGLVVATQLLLACGAGTEEISTSLQSSQDALTRAPSSRYSAEDLFRGLFFGLGPVAEKLPQLWGKGMPGAPKPEANLSNTELARRLEVESGALAKAGLNAAGQQALHGVTKALAADTLTPDEAAKEIAIDNAAIAKAPPADAAVAHLIAVINKTDPTFFARFGKEVVSGDPVAVAAAVEEAGVQMMNAAPSADEQTGTALAPGGFAASLNARASLIVVIFQVDLSRSFGTLAATDTYFASNYFVAVDRFLVANSFLVIGATDFGNTGDALRHETWMKLIATDLRS